MKALLRISDGDNVAVALRALAEGPADDLLIRQAVPAGHKVALRPIAPGEPIVKYGYPIGKARQPIAAGEHVHSHNMESALRGNLSDLAFADVAKSVAKANGRHSDDSQSARFFDGYRRKDGRAATRNEIWIVNTVGCVNRASEQIAAEAARQFAGEGRAVEGVYAFPHPFGCSQLGDDLINTQKVLAGLVNHPNAAAVLVLGLGCENNQMKLFLERVGPQEAARVKFFNAQDVTDEVEEGVRVVGALAEYAGQFKREPIPARELILGMKCGGSDGFSGITANPLVGRVADQLTAQGGSVLLTEVPEMFGAERVLLERAANEQVFRATIDLVNDFRDYFRKYNEPIDENPSPGNKDGGITTLAEKSLGCVQKGGNAAVKQVLEYGARATPGTGGIALINAPGNDGVSSTAMTIAGAHLILFTTGRGTPMGFPAPTIKISTNSALQAKKPQWIDFDAGALAEGTDTIDALAAKLFDFVLEIAGGKRRTKSEQHGYREIAIWKNGVTL